MGVPNEGYSSKASCALNYMYKSLLVTSVGGILVPESIICPVASVSALT